MPKKFLTPVVPPSLSSDPSGAVAGAIYYNTAVNSLKFYNGTTWEEIGNSGEGSTATTVQTINSYSSNPTNGTIAYNTSTGRFVIAYNNIWNEIAYKSEADSPVDGGSSSTISFDLILDGGESSDTTFVNTYYNV
jgi:hypothetical protein